MRIPRRMLPHRVVVEAYTGQGAHGPVYADPVKLRAAVEDSTRLVRRRSDGAEVVSSTTVRLDPEHVIPAESRVTVWPDTDHERVAQVITSARQVHPRTPSHIELSLT